MATKLRCPLCDAWTELLETRTHKSNPGVKRRRYECANLHRFTTMDGIVTRIDLVPPRRGGRTTPHHTT